MKKLLTILLTILMLVSISACSTKKEEIVEVVEEAQDLSTLKIVTPVGAPSVAFYNYSDNANFETNGTPANIIAMMADDNGPDVVVVDTVGGLNAISKGADYKLDAIITFGNFFIASTGNDDNGTLDSDDKIVLFGQNQTPDLVWHYIYGNEYDENIIFVNAAGDAAACLQTGLDLEGKEVDYVFLAQPALFASLKQNEKASLYANVQDLYTEKSGTSMIQAGLFIKNSLNDATVEAINEALKADIEAAVNDSSKIGEGFNKISEEEVKAKYGVAAAPIMAVVKNGNQLGLGFKKASEIKDTIDAFLTVMNKDITNEEVYR